MKITECGFNNKNIYFETLPDGRLIIANGDTGEVYEVKEVDKVQAEINFENSVIVKPKYNCLFYMSIDELGLSVRTTNALIRAGFNTVHDVIKYFGPAIKNYTFLNPDYKHINGFGPKSRRELQNKLKELGVI